MNNRVATMSMLGKRENQQDAYGYKIIDSYMLGCLCDGMGGLKGGEYASRLVVDSFIRDMTEIDQKIDIKLQLRKEVMHLDEKVFNLRDDDGKWLEAGTTMVAVVIQGDRLHWVSVGDSKIYLLRKNTMECVVREHNYQRQLEEQLRRNEINRAYYDVEIQDGDQLISYLGMGNVSMIDINQRAFQLQSGDKIFLCSDGVYRSVGEAEIQKIILEYGDCIEIAIRQLEQVIRCKDIKNQDNATALLIGCN